MRRSSLAAILACAVATTGACASRAPASVRSGRAGYARTVALPPPDTHGTVPLEATIEKRRSGRDFRPDQLPLTVIGQLLWAGQGVTDPSGKRAAPSAGALYPLELYVVTASSVLHYLPEGHRAEIRDEPDQRPALQRAAFGQTPVGTAPAVIVVAAVASRTRSRYGPSADAFVNREAGHATENLLLEATALDLVAVPIGSFDAVQVAESLALPPDNEVLYLVPVGRPAT